MMTLHMKQAKRTTQAHPLFGGLGKDGPTGLLFDSLLISIVGYVETVSIAHILEITGRIVTLITFGGLQQNSRSVAHLFNKQIMEK